MTDKIPEDIARLVDLAMLSDNVSKNAWEMMAKLVMAERQRCYDLAKFVCDNDFDGVTGSLDDDILTGKVLEEKPGYVMSEAELSRIKESKARQAKQLERYHAFKVIMDSMAYAQPTGEKTSTVKFMRQVD